MNDGQRYFANIVDRVPEWRKKIEKGAELSRLVHCVWQPATLFAAASVAIYCVTYYVLSFHAVVIYARFSFFTLCIYHFHAILKREEQFHPHALQK